MEYIQHSETSRGFFNLESRLAESLRTVRPDPAFLNSLKEKLAQRSSTIVETRSNHYEFLFIGMGLATGAVILWLLRRMKRL